MKSKSIQKLGKPSKPKSETPTSSDSSSKEDARILMGKALANLGRWIREDPAHRALVVYEDDSRTGKTEYVLCISHLGEDQEILHASPLAYIVDPLDMSYMGRKQPKSVITLRYKDVMEFDMRLFNPLEPQ